MKSEKIIVFEKFLEEHDLRRLYLLFNSNKFKILSLQQILYDEIYQVKKTNDFTIAPKNIKELKDFVLKNKEKKFILFFDLNFQVSKNILFLLRKVEYDIYYLNNYPDVRPYFKSLISHFFYQFLYKLFLINAPREIFITGGKIPNNRLFPRSSITKFNFSQSIDFINYTNEKKQIFFQNEYFVFLDDMYPIHPDLNKKSIIDSKYYFDEINLLLKKISKQFNIECVISAHPRAPKGYEKHFKFKVYFNNTNSLVKNSKFVIGHATTSYSYALFNFKPINIIMFKNQKNNYSLLAKRFSKEFGCNYYLVEEINNFEISKVNKEIYEKYIKNYHFKNFKIIKP